MDNVKNMNKLIIANWKMNISVGESKKIIRSILSFLKRKKQNSHVVICPDYLSCDSVQQEIKKSHLKKIELGAQNCAWETRGAYTGEVSPIFLEKLGCRWVILGHSERRYLLGESDEIVRKKIQTLIDTKISLHPIVCIGERFENDSEQKKKHFLKKQLEYACKNISIPSKMSFTIAYEPVWAIGSGKFCTPNICQERIAFFKDTLSGILDPKIVDRIHFIYGGSVTLENAKNFIHEGGCDGLLVGGASLSVREFCRIIESVS